MIRNTKGFTIIELMTTVAILAVIAALAVPSIGNLMRKNKLTAAANELYASVSIARSEAIKRKSNITLEPVGNNWGNGWRVMDGVNKVNQSNPIAEGFSGSSQADKGVLTFSPSGYTTVSNPWGVDDGVKFCDGDGKAKIVTVRTSGSIAVKDASC